MFDGIVIQNRHCTWQLFQVRVLMLILMFIWRLREYRSFYELFLIFKANPSLFTALNLNL